jgi:hypothetical protein
VLEGKGGLWNNVIKAKEDCGSEGGKAVLKGGKSLIKEEFCSKWVQYCGRGVEVQYCMWQRGGVMWLKKELFCSLGIRGDKNARLRSSSGWRG